MELSLARELIRFQDTLVLFLPSELWQKWAEVNEEVVDYLQQN